MAIRFLPDLWNWTCTVDVATMNWLEGSFWLRKISEISEMWWTWNFCPVLKWFIIIMIIELHESRYHQTSTMSTEQRLQNRHRLPSTSMWYLSKYAMERMTFGAAPKDEHSVVDRTQSSCGTPYGVHTEFLLQQTANALYQSEGSVIWIVSI